MHDAKEFLPQAQRLFEVLAAGKRVLLTAPGAADGDSVGSQLALRALIQERFPQAFVAIVNDEPLPDRYQSVLGVQHLETPETFLASGEKLEFDVGILVDGGIDRAGRLRPVFERCSERVFIDHHAVSCSYAYTLPIVAPHASATTELIYYLSQLPLFEKRFDRAFAEWVYLGLIFDTGLFRNRNTTPDVLELAARCLRTGIDAPRLGQQVLLERPTAGFRLLASTLSDARWVAEGRILWSSIAQHDLNRFDAQPDDREGIIDSMVLTAGVEVAALFFELPGGRTKVSLRSRGKVNVAEFARSLCDCGGGHRQAAGAELSESLEATIAYVLRRLTDAVQGEQGVPYAAPVPLREAGTNSTGVGG